MSKEYPKAYCLECKRKVTIQEAVECGSRISGTCPWCDKKVSVLRIKSCRDPKEFDRKIHTVASKKSKAKRSKFWAKMRGADD